MILSALLLLQAAGSAPQDAVAAPPPSERDSDAGETRSISAADGTIVVIGRRPDATAAALADCIRRGCPPDEDIAATLAHANTLFLDGKYLEARSTLLAGRGRNKRHATRYPVQVSDLSNVLSRMSTLTGWREQARLFAIEGTDALRAGLPADDPLILMQRLLVGGTLLRQGRIEGAEDIYRSVLAQARRSGAVDVEARAMIDIAMMYIAAAASRPGYRGRAIKAIADIESTTNPALSGLRETVPFLRAQVKAIYAPGDKGDGAVAALGDRKALKPVLIYAPSMDLQLRGYEPLFEVTAGTTTELMANRTPDVKYDIRDQWIDIGFRVLADGTVRDVEVLRSGKNVATRWVSVAREKLAQRRYQPLALAPDDPGILKIERLSFVSDRGQLQASRLSGNVGTPRLEITDLTFSAALLPKR